jgi:hypothetical protein
MRLNKSFIGTTRQSKLDSLKSFFAIIFWLLISIIIAVLFTFTLNTLYPSSYVSELINNQGVSFIYTMWTVQATVTVLAFFISNIMTSIVKDVFYGLSIRDILIARVKWYEVSFWHQSIVCILLVIINIPFILLGLTPAVLVIVSFNLLFIIYMLNNAFSYVFNAAAIVARVDQIVQKEISTGKTILDLNQLLMSLEIETKRRITNNELKKTIYNVNFFVRIYSSLKDSSKADYLPQNLKMLKSVLLYLAKLNNFETLDYCLNNIIKPNLNNQEYSDLICELIESISLRFINYSMLEIEEYKVHEHLLSWSSVKDSSMYVDSIANSFYNYYNSILLNSKITNLTKKRLLKKLFTSLVNPREANYNQQSAFKIALMHITKEMLLAKNSEDFKELVDTLNPDNFEEKDFLNEVISLLNIYVFYVYSSNSVNKFVKKTAKEFLHLQPNIAEINNHTLADMLTNSGAKLIKYFWQDAKIFNNFTTTDKLSISRSKKDFDINYVTNFYLIYWKFFASSLENISLNQTAYNKNFYNDTIESLVNSVKQDENNSYNNFTTFCKLYNLDYSAIKKEPDWVVNVEKIDNYIRDVYIEHLTTLAKTSKKYMLKTNTTPQKTKLLKVFKGVNNILSIVKNNHKKENGITVSVPIMCRVNKLKTPELTEESTKEYANKYKEIIFNQVRHHLLKLDIETLMYNKEKNNLDVLLEKIGKLNIDAITHKLSSNIDVLNNQNDSKYINALIKKEENFKLLSELDLNEYLFINTNNCHISFLPKNIRFRNASEIETENLINKFKSSTIQKSNKYKIKNYFGTKKQAIDYYSCVYIVADLKIDIVNNLKPAQMFKLQIK